MHAFGTIIWYVVVVKPCLWFRYLYFNIYCSTMSSGAGPSTSQPVERASDILRVPDENHQLSRVLQNAPQTLSVRGHQRHVRTHARCRDMLVAMGLYQLSELKIHKTDPAIITALVERYRSETHSFNMPTGKNCKFISSISFYLFSFVVLVC